MSFRFALWVGVLLAVGCVKPTPNPPLPENQRKDSPATAPAPQADVPVSPPTGGGIAAPPIGDATAAATAFLKAVHDGTATAAGLTPAFKKVIAAPVFDADIARGYSDSAADSWLKQYQGKLTAPSVYPFGGDANAQLYTAFLPGEKPRHVTLRLTKGDAGWLADWFLPVEVEPTAVKTGDAATFAAVAFLEAVLGQQGHAAAGLMTAAAKTRLAPPFGGQKQAYNAGLLDQKLAGYRGTFTGFTVAKAEGGSVTGELTGPGGKKAYTLKVLPGEWLIDDVKID